MLESTLQWQAVAERGKISQQSGSVHTDEHALGCVQASYMESSLDARMLALTQMA